MERDDPRTVARLQFFFWAHCAATENMEIEPWICFLRRNSLGYSNIREYADAYMAALGVMLLDCKKNKYKYKYIYIYTKIYYIYLKYYMSILYIYTEMASCGARWWPNRYGYVSNQLWCLEDTFGAPPTLRHIHIASPKEPWSNWPNSGVTVLQLVHLQKDPRSWGHRQCLRQAIWFLAGA